MGKRGVNKGNCFTYKVPAIKLSNPSPNLMLSLPIFLLVKIVRTKTLEQIGFWTNSTINDVEGAAAGQRWFTATTASCLFFVFKVELWKSRINTQECWSFTRITR